MKFWYAPERSCCFEIHLKKQMQNRITHWNWLFGTEESMIYFFFLSIQQYANEVFISVPSTNFQRSNLAKSNEKRGLTRFHKILIMISSLSRDERPGKHSTGWLQLQIIYTKLQQWEIVKWTKDSGKLWEPRTMASWGFTSLTSLSHGDQSSVNDFSSFVHGDGVHREESASEAPTSWGDNFSSRQ